MASLPCNTDSLYKVPLNPDPQKGPNLGLISTSCSGRAVLPTARCSALPSGGRHQGGRALARAGIPAMPTMPCPPLCPQRVRSPSKQEARISQGPRRLPSESRPPGSGAEAALQEELLLLVTLCPSLARAVTGTFRAPSPSGPPLPGRVLPHFFVRPFF